jgi:hypothetical protein
VTGYADLIRNRHLSAISVRGYDAIIGNVPDDLKEKAKLWTCAEFVKYWVQRFNTEMRKAEV